MKGPKHTRTTEKEELGNNQSTGSSEMSPYFSSSKQFSQLTVLSTNRMLTHKKGGEWREETPLKGKLNEASFRLSSSADKICLASALPLEKCKEEYLILQ